MRTLCIGSSFYFIVIAHFPRWESSLGNQLRQPAQANRRRCRRWRNSHFIDRPPLNLSEWPSPENDLHCDVRIKYHIKAHKSLGKHAVFVPHDHMMYAHGQVTKPTVVASIIVDCTPVPGKVSKESQEVATVHSRGGFHRPLMWLRECLMLAFHLCVGTWRGWKDPHHPSLSPSIVRMLITTISYLYFVVVEASAFKFSFRKTIIPHHWFGISLEWVSSNWRLHYAALPASNCSMIPVRFLPPIFRHGFTSWKVIASNGCNICRHIYVPLNWSSTTRIHICFERTFF
jgi:hypothetical protein